MQSNYLYFTFYYFIIKFIIPVISTLDICIKIAAIARNGPNGIKLSLLLRSKHIATGKAINVAKKISQMDKG